MEGPAAAEFQAAFAEHWIEETRELLLGDRHFPKINPAGERGAQVVASSTHQRNVMHLMLMAVLAAAQKNIRIATPYFVPDEMTRQQLLEARARGVDIQILVPERTPMRAALGRRRGTCGGFAPGKREDQRVPTDFFHCKLVVVDAIWTSVGSTNIDDRAVDVGGFFGIGAKPS